MGARKYFLLFLIFIVVFFGCNSSTGTDSKEPESISVNTHTFSSLQDAYPTHSSQDQIIEHLAYSIKYNEAYEQPDWVIYSLTKEHLGGDNVPKFL